MPFENFPETKPLPRLEPKQNEIPPICVAGNEVQFFTESDSYLSSLQADIQGAKKRIWIESYIIADSEKLQSMMAAVRERAAAGVDCRITYDAVGSFGTSVRFWEALRLAKVKVYAYRPLSKWWRRAGFFTRFRWLRR